MFIFKNVIGGLKSFINNKTMRLFIIAVKQLVWFTSLSVKNIKIKQFLLTRQ